jgi:hypothetical protein
MEKVLLYTSVCLRSNIRICLLQPSCIGPSDVSNWTPPWYTVIHFSRSSGQEIPHCHPWRLVGGRNASTLLHLGTRWMRPASRSGVDEMTNRKVIYLCLESNPGYPDRYQSSYWQGYLCFRNIVLLQRSQTVHLAGRYIQCDAFRRT